MQPPLRRAFGNSKLPREIRDWDPMQVVHHQQLALVHTQPIECAVQRRHAGSRDGRVLALKGERAIEVDLSRAPATPEGIAAAVEDHLVQPRVEPGSVTKL